MILFTGKGGKAGSWQIRGEQLGGEVGVVKANASYEDCKAADLIVVVKRLSPALLANIRRSGTPWVWDVVDFYPQPTCTDWGRSKSINWVKSHIQTANPNAVIWPNARMGEDCRSARKDFVLYHHCRHGAAVNPVRSDIRVVGYEGSPNYIGKWGKRLIRECDARGWDFYVNHGQHHQWDICVAFRDDSVNGYAQRHWKSNVKLQNAQATGTPFIGPGEFGYIETASGAELWVDHPKALGQALDSLASQERRQHISDVMRGRTYTLQQAAADLRQFLEGI